MSNGKDSYYFLTFTKFNLYDFQETPIRNLVDCLLNGVNKGEKYCRDVRMFALNLRYQSPSGYDYLRLKFNKHLPHPTTIRKWFSISSVNSGGGMNVSALETIKEAVQDLEKKNLTIFAAISFDEVNIRQHVQYIHAKKYFSGYTNLATLHSEDEPLPVATHAIVIMLNGINVQLTIPIAHFFITALCAEEKAVLICSILKALSEIGVRVFTITADGLSSNAAAIDILGASFKFNNLKPYFKNPFDGHTIYYFFDPPHMIKLVRNCIGECKTLTDNQGRKIEWKFIERLYRATKNDIASHKLTKKHLQWSSMPMKVCLATQTLSNSVAQSIENLCHTKQFRDSEGTAEFIERFNKLFDIFNSNERNQDNIFKSPINATSKGEIFHFLDDMVDYIQHLSWIGKPLIESQKNTAFLGFCSNITALKLIYVEIVEKGLISDFKVRKIQQDILESFFSRMRKNGSNDNPTIQQFNANFHRTLINTELTSSVFANCVDNLDLLTVSSTLKNVESTPSYIMYSKDVIREIEMEEEEVEEILNIHPIEDVEIFERNVEEDVEESVNNLSVSNVAGFIESLIEKNHKFNCSDCAFVFELNGKIDPKIFVKHSKNVLPCKSTFDICHIANGLVSNYFNINHESRFEYDKLFTTIKNRIVYKNYFSLSDFTHTGGETHREFIIDFIIEEFIRIRCVSRARSITLEGQDDFIRSVKRNDIHFAGQ